MLISNIIDRVIQGQRITLAQSVGPYLTPIYIDDLIEVFQCFLQENEFGNVSSIYNVCGDEKISLREIVSFIEKVTSSHANIDISSEKIFYFAGSNLRLKEKYSNLVFSKFDEVLYKIVGFHTLP
jgi:nucleoside-diphosphate-sugar epimerase